MDKAGTEIKNKNGDTALHVAVTFQNLKCIQALVENGADKRFYFIDPPPQGFIYPPQTFAQPYTTWASPYPPPQLVNVSQSPPQFANSPEINSPPSTHTTQSMIHKNKSPSDQSIKYAEPLYKQEPRFYQANQHLRRNRQDNLGFPLPEEEVSPTRQGHQFVNYAGRNLNEWM